MNLFEHAVSLCFQLLNKLVFRIKLLLEVLLLPLHFLTELCLLVMNLLHVFLVFELQICELVFKLKHLDLQGLLFLKEGRGTVAFDKFEFQVFFFHHLL